LKKSESGLVITQEKTIWGKKLVAGRGVRKRVLETGLGTTDGNN
jgi:hypothetical protein